MKLSLLDMVQNILSALDSDPVDSIDETVEAVQVAEIIKEAYFSIISQRDWPFLFILGSLTALGDVNNPTKMQIPTTYNKIKWIKYNKKQMQYVDPETFHEIISNRVAQAGVINSSGYVINADPVYWTTYDDNFVYFDGYDSAEESSLQQSNCTAYGTQQASWSHVDTFTPALPEKFFPTLLAEAKSQAFANLKQQSNAREETKARRGITTMRNEAWKTEDGEAKYNNRVNYGRK